MEITIFIGNADVSDLNMWDNVGKGPFIPTKRVKDAEIVKPREECTLEDKKKMLLNIGTMNAIYGAFSTKEFNPIFNCQTTKEI